MQGINVTAWKTAQYFSLSTGTEGSHVLNCGGKQYAIEERAWVLESDAWCQNKHSRFTSM